MARSSVLLLLGLLPFAAGAQFIQQGPKLTGSGAVGLAQQGFSVAVSADGNTLIAGGPTDTPTILGNAPGAAWIFTRSGNTWSQQGPKLVGSGGDGYAFQGYCVGLSSDGNTAILGGPYDNNLIGSAWIFTRSGGVWRQQGDRLAATGGSAAQQIEFGTACALSSDGNTAVIGSYDGAWVFIRSAGVWKQQARLSGAAGFPPPLFGASVAIAGDGETIFVGAYNDNANTGSAWIFTRNGGQWTQQGPRLVGTGAIGTAIQAYSAALSFDGNTLVIGGPGDNDRSGAIWFVTRSGGVWTQQGKKVTFSELTIGQGSFGRAVTLSGDCQTAVVGGFGSSFSDNGATWVFRKIQGVWAQQGRPFIGTGASTTSIQCCGLAISSDGGTIVASSPSDGSSTRSGIGFGATWVFARHRLQITAPAAAVTGVPLTFRVQAVEPNNVPNANYDGAVTLTSSDPQARFPQTVNLSQGAGTFVATFSTPGQQTISATYVPSPFVEGTSNPVTVTLPGIEVAAFVNAASFVTGPVAPNTLIAAFGKYPGCASGAEVTVDGVSTQVFGSAATQVNFLLPQTAAGRQSVNVQIACAGLRSPPLPLPLATVSPALFTMAQNGTGQAATVNPDGTAGTPVRPGSIVSLYATGLGSLVRGADGLAHVLLPVTVSIANAPATVFYAGEAPGFTSGLQQINIQVPVDAPTGGPLPLQISAGGVTSQPGVTIVVQ